MVATEGFEMRGVKGGSGGWSWDLLAYRQDLLGPSGSSFCCELRSLGLFVGPSGSLFCIIWGDWDPPGPRFVASFAPSDYVFGPSGSLFAIIWGGSEPLRVRSAPLLAVRSAPRIPSKDRRVLPPPGKPLGKLDPNLIRIILAPLEP